MVVPVDNASINIIFVCKLLYIDSVIKVVAVGNPHNYPTYTPTKLTKEEIRDNDRSELSFFRISTIDVELDLPSLY